MSNLNPYPILPFLARLGNEWLVDLDICPENSLYPPGCKSRSSSRKKE